MFIDTQGTQMIGHGRVRDVQVSAHTIPTDGPETDGTLEWNATTIVIVEASAQGATGLGYTYADRATAALVRDRLAPIVRGCEPDGIPAVWRAMVRSVRNLGRPGIASMAIAAVDVALWDLKARI
ncbi:MAG: enolase C-terminal domain-like protein, partial [Polyangiaceae bacterium]